ncbi:hypothetical protein EIN_503130 [Entamoeba invadens IP1]|uniref:Uncharacterized protein n=1 Tax=Entamoeba invadens IP1 TaxID=370355 RepID=A0A0A1U782_ENTIV|nr:hypothetical protein EIN_503130 [Entamoeba invadens IP1]ELP90267.1 hypothetical protein EIN_503130 [Entamoeba invadens IP1]|eukprot:XP_004257038.1 hypothetical protein EIN_503130 [Entamoeba invadens IP1]
MNYWSGMFRFPPMASPLDILLGKADCTLEKLLNEEDFISEIRRNNDLMDFCVEPENIQRYLKYTTYDITPTDDPVLFEKYHAICISIFTDEPSHIIDVIGTNEELVEYLFEAIRSNNEKRMSAGGLVLNCVIQVGNAVVYDLFTKDETMLNTLMARLDITGFLDSIFQIMKLDDIGKEGCIDWLCNKGFIPKLITTLMGTQSLDIISNISSFIRNVVMWKVSNDNSHIFRFITLLNSNEILPKFVQSMFESQDDLYVEHCFIIVSNILACSTILTYTNPDELPGIFKALLPHISHFDEVFRTRKSGGVLNNLVYIVLSLVLSGFKQIYDKLARENVLNVMMEVFYMNHSCTILRQTIKMTFLTVVNGNAMNVKLKLLDGGKLLKTFVEMDKKAVEEKKEKNLGPDYWLIAARLMRSVLQSVEDKGEEDDFYTAIIGDKEFVDYVNTVVVPRDDETSECFNKQNTAHEDSEQSDDSQNFDDDGFDNIDEDFDDEEQDVDDEIVRNDDDEEDDDENDDNEDVDDEIKNVEDKDDDDDIVKDVAKEGDVKQ